MLVSSDPENLLWDFKHVFCEEMLFLVRPKFQQNYMFSRYNFHILKNKSFSSIMIVHQF